MQVSDLDRMWAKKVDKFIASLNEKSDRDSGEGGWQKSADIDSEQVMKGEALSGICEQVDGAFTEAEQHQRQCQRDLFFEPCRAAVMAILESEYVLHQLPDIFHHLLEQREHVLKARFLQAAIAIVLSDPEKLKLGVELVDIVAKRMSQCEDWRRWLDGNFPLLWQLDQYRIYLPRVLREVRNDH